MQEIQSFLEEAFSSLAVRSPGSGIADDSSLVWFFTPRLVYAALSTYNKDILPSLNAFAVIRLWSSRSVKLIQLRVLPGHKSAPTLRDKIPEAKV